MSLGRTQLEYAELPFGDSASTAGQDVREALGPTLEKVFKRESQKERDDARQLLPSLGADEGRTLGLFALRDELNSVRNIAATTLCFIDRSRSEATWNNQAAIAKSFVPPARGELETLGGKMIDYALILRPEKQLAVRIASFVDGFDGPRTFNQSTHGTLCYDPTGVLIETKVDIRRHAEGKAQLGI